MTAARTIRSAPSLAPGLGLSLAGAAVAVGVNTAFPAVSAMLVAILLGAVLTNLRPQGLPAMLAPGLAIASRRLLRLGVVLLGLQLVLGDILMLGWPVLVGVLAVVVGTIGSTIVLGRLLALRRPQALLIAAGFSICGAAAVAGMEGVLSDQDEEDAPTAVALVVVFGTLMIAVMPLLTSACGMDQRSAGLWTGASVHEVAQVVAAAGIIGPAALTVAVVVKLARVLMLAPLLAAVSLWQRRRAAKAGGKLPPLVPLFVAGFVAMVVVRSLGLLPQPVLDGARIVQTWLLAAAMFALGTSVHWTVFRRTGGRPVLLAGLATLVALLIGFGVAVLA